MAYDTLKKQFSREHLWYCEIEVDGETYRFCENISPIPAGLSVEAGSMSAPSLRPAQIDLTGGIGVRASVNVSFKEHMDYVRFGSLSAPRRFWPNWRANHPGYQGARLSVFSGYLGADGGYSLVNFQRRDYVIESFSHNEKGASITAKDTLKLVSGDRAKAPRKSLGVLAADITDTATSLTLSPSGVGDANYAASGYVRIGEEVMSFTRSGDVMTVVRNDPPGDYETVAEAHSQNDTVQECLYYNDTVTDTLYDLLTVYGSVPTSQIDLTQWENEATLYIPGLYEALITEPVGISTLLKELGESAPHYMYWDERTNKIIFKAVKPPPETSNPLTAESNLLESSTSVKDEPDMRISTVIVRFGQLDPTKELDDNSNYRQAHVRYNLDSVIDDYNGIEKYKVINSRWINNSNRVAAIRLAARFGRRFQDIPRRLSFALDAKDSDVWTGDPVFINSDLIVDSSGNRVDLPVQVLSVREQNGKFIYDALEYGYGVELPEDLTSEDPDQRLILLSGELTNINLRTIYDSIYPDVTNDYDIVFIFDNACVVGSTSNASFSVDTGAWSEITTGDPIKLDIRGLIVGKGGDGGDTGTAEDGGPAILLNTDVRWSNTGLVAGGGGGGAGAVSQTTDVTPPEESSAGGGGGAGYNIGLANTSTYADGVDATTTSAQNGTTQIGGAGAYASTFETEAIGGAGGDLGQDGGDGTASGEGTTGTPGLAGAAIDQNGYTITYIDTGTILGSIIP